MCVFNFWKLALVLALQWYDNFEKSKTHTHFLKQIIFLKSINSLFSVIEAHRLEYRTEGR